MELLRFATAGSVDDGKSTLIGRLLYDSKSDLRGPARGGRAHEPRPRRRVRRPRAAHRRAARRARAGDHDRRRLPLLRDTPAQVHHRRHAGAHPAHAQHGDGLLHGRPRRRARRRAQRDHRADAAPRLRSPRCCGSRTSCSASTRWTSSTTTKERFEEVRAEFEVIRGPTATSPTSPSSRSRRCAATTSSSARARCRGTREASLLHHLEDVQVAADPGTIGPALPGAVGDPPAQLDPPRLPGLCRAGRGGVGAARRRGRRPAVGAHAPRSSRSRPPTGRSRRPSRRCRWSLRLADELDVSRGDLICRPGDLPTVGQELSATLVLDGRAATAAGSAAGDQAHDALGESARATRCATGSTSTPCSARPTPASWR